jgi:hypothetical protein
MKPVCKRTRRGAAAVEGAVVLGALTLLLLGMMELALMLMNHTAMSEGARRIARAAIVHGDRCGGMGEWGPAPLLLQGDDDHAAAAALRDVLCSLSPGQVQIEVTWLNGDNAAGDRVRVKVQHTHQPVVPAWGWNTGLVLSGTSTMLIAH